MMFLSLLLFLPSGLMRLFGIMIAFAVASIVESKVYTHECMIKAEFTSCSVFNSCCDFRCSRSKQKRSTCTIDGSEINSVQTECVCTTPMAVDVPYQRKSKHSRLDLIAGILFIFVVDMLLLSFTF